MKIFIYKTFIVVIAAYILFQFTIGIIIRNYENKFENLIHNKQTREKIIETTVARPLKKGIDSLPNPITDENFMDLSKFNKDYNLLEKVN